MSTEYKKTMQELHQLPPTTLMEDTDTEGFQQFVNALETEAHGQVLDADAFFHVKPQ